MIGSLHDKVFCAGANIGMLAVSPHPLKVNFCKFTNETRHAIEDATTNSGQRYIAAVKGNAAGGGRARPCHRPHHAHRRRLVVSGLARGSLLGVLPGTGGLTRLIDKRHVRRDRADVFCTVEEGTKSALEWRLVDELVASSSFDETVRGRAMEMASATDRTADAEGLELAPLQREFGDDTVIYSSLRIEIDRAIRTATLTIIGPEDRDHGRGAGFWPLRLARELDDAILHRVNELEIGTLILRSVGDPDDVEGFDRLLSPDGDWFLREVSLYWKRLLKRLDATSRTVICLVEPGSCFVGFLAEVVLAADRSYMLEGTWPGRRRRP